MTALSWQSSPLFQDGSHPRGWRWMQPVAPHRARGCCIRGVMVNGFTPDFVLWLKTLQRKLMCALVVIQIISIYMAQGLQPNILPYIVCVCWIWRSISVGMLQKAAQWWLLEVVETFSCSNAAVPDVAWCEDVLYIRSILFSWPNYVILHP